jgi:hypothetical protein
MKKILYCLSFLALFSCSTKEKSTQSAATDTVRAATATASGELPREVATKPGSTNQVPANAGKWQYDRTTDQTNNPVYKASIIASNLLEFPFPYEGGSSATLTIRKRSSGTNVYLEVSKGQFNRSFQGGNARIRFDNKPAIPYAFSAAENGRANIIFFDSEQKLINQLKTAKETVIDVGFNGQGTREIKFRTAGLDWNH